MTTINELYRVGNVASIMLPDECYELGLLPMAVPELILGIELELEGYHDGVEGQGRFTQTEDGSLRNGGIEAVSLPLKAKYVESTLRDFFAENNTSDANYSDRTSIHVHVNMQDMTMEQVRAVALTYQTVERLLFDAFVGEERENNVFCVPWYQAGFTVSAMDKMIANFDGQIRQWVKYTALNMLPLREKGTIEFRHLKGTCDVEYIITWINIISSIVKYGTSTSYEEISRTIINMNTDSNYEMFLQNVFGEYGRVLAKAPNYQSVLAYGVVDSKLLLVSQPKSKYQANPFFAEDYFVARQDEVVLPIPEGIAWTNAMATFAQSYLRAYPENTPEQAVEAALTAYGAVNVPPQPAADPVAVQLDNAAARVREAVQRHAEEARRIRIRRNPR